MEQVTRRRLLGLVPGAGLATIFGPELACAAGPTPNVVELFVVGPLRLGEWLKRGYGDKWLVKNGKAGPDLKTAVTALNTAPLYIIDVRDTSDPRKPRFAAALGYPALVVAKQGTHLWKKDGDSFRLSLEEMSIGVDSTYGQPPIRKVIAAVQLELLDAAQLELKEYKSLAVKESTMAVSDRITYDVKGKLLVGSQAQNAN